MSRQQLTKMASLRQTTDSPLLLYRSFKESLFPILYDLLLLLLLLLLLALEIVLSRNEVSLKLLRTHSFSLLHLACTFRRWCDNCRLYYTFISYHHPRPYCHLSFPSFTNDPKVDPRLQHASASRILLLHRKFQIFVLYIVNSVRVPFLRRDWSQTFSVFCVLRGVVMVWWWGCLP